MTGLLGGILMAALAGAQAAPLTLDQAIAEALRAEPGLQAARAQIDVARAERHQAELRPNPAASFDQREQIGGMDRQTSIGVMLPLDLYGRGPRIDSAGFASDRTKAMVSDRERLLAAAVRDRYGDVLAASRRLAVVDGVVAAARQTLDLLSNRVREGAAPTLDRDLALVELRRLEGERALQAGRVDVASRNLDIVLGRPADAPVVLADSLEQLASDSVSENTPPAGDRADVQAATADLAAMRAQTSLAEQADKPTFTVVGGYMRMESGFPLRGVTAAGMLAPIQMTGHNVVVGVTVSLPLVDHGQAAVAAAKAREAAAAAALAERRLAASGEVAAAEARLAAARASLLAYGDDTRALARRNVDVMRETYVLGRATLLDVLTEQRRFLDFEGGYVAALAEAAAAVTELQRAKGALK
jgi:cobalt-zinc-cadmium efflux system outer membrane protein